MKKPKRNNEKNNMKKNRKKKKNQNLESEMDIYQRISPLEKFNYPKQLEIKQRTVLEWTQKYQKKTKKVFKMDAKLIRQSWLKEDYELRNVVNEIVFKCNDLKVRSELSAALKIQKEQFIKNDIEPKNEGKFRFNLK